MAHFGFEAYRQGFFGELLHGRGRFLANGVGSVEKMTKTARLATLCRLATRLERLQAAVGRLQVAFRRSLIYRNFNTALYRRDSRFRPSARVGIFVADEKTCVL
ncbi:MAG TPA: hypothetical protein VFS06_12480 [Casimicrobiaceae bacterium]|jgi:hypothetical protein|nr:hypothetical protein [Casimicrobiaceae bacterium]